MANTADWPLTLKLLDEERLYSLKELQLFLSDHGHTVKEQAIYRWIKRRKIPKQGTVSGNLSRQNLVVWLGNDLKNALEIGLTL